MSDSDAQSTSVGHGGFVYLQGCRLPMRLVNGSLEFVVKNPRDRARLKCSRIEKDLDKFYLELKQARRAK